MYSCPLLAAVTTPLPQLQLQFITEGSTLNQALEYSKIERMIGVSAASNKPPFGWPSIHGTWADRSTSPLFVSCHPLAVPFLFVESCRHL